MIALSWTLEFEAGKLVTMASPPVPLHTRPTRTLLSTPRGKQEGKTASATIDTEHIGGSHMRVVVTQIGPGVWTIRCVSAVAVSAGRTTYPSKELAVETARHQHPGVEIEVEE